MRNLIALCSLASLVASITTKKRHNTSPAAPSYIVSTYTSLTYVPIVPSPYEPYEDSLSMNAGGLQPVTVTAILPGTTILVTVTTTSTYTQSYNQQTSAQDGSNYSGAPTSDSTTIDGDNGSNDGSVSSQTDAGTNGSNSYAFPSVSIYAPTSSKKHHFF